MDRVEACEEIELASLFLFMAKEEFRHKRRTMRRRRNRFTFASWTTTTKTFNLASVFTLLCLFRDRSSTIRAHTFCVVAKSVMLPNLQSNLLLDLSEVRFLVRRESI
jgi:hypothetical protein